MNELLPCHFDDHILTLTSFRSTTFDGTPSPKSSIIYEAYTTPAVPSFRILKMLDPAIHMPAGVNRESHGTTSRPMGFFTLIHLLIGLVFRKYHLLIMSLSRGYLVQLVGCCSRWGGEPRPDTLLLRYLAPSSCELRESKTN